jgi:MoxR-like ATPase
VIDGVLTSLFCGGHTLLEGVPGLGKTLLIRTLARSLDLAFARIQFTPDLMPADITGTTIVVESDGHAGARTREFRFQPGPVFAQIVLADEINRATPKTQSAMLEAMQERAVTAGGQTRPLPRPFFVLSTQNPIEQEGTYPLPEAQLDRFFFKLLVGPSGRAELAQILDRTTAGTHAEPERVLGAERILEMQRFVERVAIAPHVIDYAVRLVLATHPKLSSRGLDSAVALPTGGGFGTPGDTSGLFATPMVNRCVRFGASPRAAQALALGAKCRALLDARAAASITDVQSVALPALRHRLILNFEAQAEGVTTDDVIANVLSVLPVKAES